MNPYAAALLTAVTLSAAVVAVLRRRYVSVRVEGMSMSPTYAPGEVIVIRRSHRVLRVGDVVVVQRPPAAADPDQAEQRWLIKRVAAVAGDPLPAAMRESTAILAGHADDAIVPAGTVVILGDSPIRGYDSRSVGFIPVGHVLGVAIRSRPPVADGSAPRISLSTRNDRGPR
ncbi:S26 family signal peptidase [Hamadaea sp. NPDC051192]|uniref:S26 family signal peptidase n=1 Tax=Hamadaea sp. NPDC051192 TaxID=3154940 RepID=UPI003446910A